MKQLVPFEKEITFKSKIEEIVSISLDHDLTLKDNDTIAGNLYLKGSYKMLPTSEIETEYSYKIPVEIAISDNYDAYMAKASIDDFNYEIDNDTLKIKVDVLIDNLEEKKDVNEVDNVEEIDNIEDKRCYDDIDVKENVNSDVKSIEISNELNSDNSKKIDIEYNQNNDNEDVNLFMKGSVNIIEEEKYLTYSVYLVKEEDTIDTILNKYKVNISLLQDYNDLSNITPGMKLIIPSITND